MIIYDDNMKVHKRFPVGELPAGIGQKMDCVHQQTFRNYWRDDVTMGYTFLLVLK